ncbi:MAG: GTP cyclohydrolase II RibA [Actinomycetota bacterium]|nr:GTP cyclohydrolase II RibA [Actinomycetota bacterium]
MADVPSPKLVRTVAATSVAEVARVSLPTPFGFFQAHAFECGSGFVYVALIFGDIGDGRSVLARIHSECLTGDALGSLRCDCGVQLRASLRAIAAEGRGILVYATGHEGRGIGLVNKLRAYVEQDNGSDTVDANLHLGLPVDGRDYTEAIHVLNSLSVKSVRLLTNNPRKVQAFKDSGVFVEEVIRAPVAPHVRNISYLSTKRDRLGHSNPLGASLDEIVAVPTDVSKLIGPIRSRSDRPFVTLKYAQSIDGRIATGSGDSKWISGQEERAISHALRAHCDAIMVGVGTVLTDDPELTVRMVEGASPMRVVLDSRLRTPTTAKILNERATTLIITTKNADAERVESLRAGGAAVHVLTRGTGGVDLPAALLRLKKMGIQSLLVEGGARVITSLLSERLVDRMIVSVAPKVLGSGTEGIGDLRISQVTDGLSLSGRSVHLAGDDVLISANVDQAATGAAPEIRMRTVPN